MPLSKVLCGLLDCSGSSTPQQVSKAGSPRASGQGSGQQSPNPSVASTIKSLHSIESGLRRLSEGLHSQDSLAAELKEWLDTIDAATYRKEEWSEEVRQAYDAYKKEGDKLKATHQAYWRYMKEHPRNGTPEEHLQRTKLACSWAYYAVSAVEGRTEFLVKYRNAYNGKLAIDNHINEAKNQINSGRNAIREARHNYKAIWTAFTRRANPEVFQ
ncbi:uncharacterized protein F4822DRAFT_424895 [Hypoxylon trugodes]|uniref:uncharacterized protein n=1 Tax=Hypoxylon trugodes TaxID=326681 RepID=UPI00218D444E|nr:uncharacterized protein F4822DRAFT_424895 [Hypoxylon trugodes]KAI1394416.1 hypothetical protein F4822DRAFT_424895 [Hypoxylon trugodes]